MPEVNIPFIIVCILCVAAIIMAIWAFYKVEFTGAQKEKRRLLKLKIIEGEILNLDQCINSLLDEINEIYETGVYKQDDESISKYSMDKIDLLRLYTHAVFKYTTKLQNLNYKYQKLRKECEENG